MNDHDSFVRIEAIESFTSILDILKNEVHTFFPVLKQLYEEKNEEIL